MMRALEMAKVRASQASETAKARALAGAGQASAPPSVLGFAEAGGVARALVMESSRPGLCSHWSLSHMHCSHVAQPDAMLPTLRVVSLSLALHVSVSVALQSVQYRSPLEDHSKTSPAAEASSTNQTSRSV